MRRPIDSRLSQRVANMSRTSRTSCCTAHDLNGDTIAKFWTGENWLKINHLDTCISQKKEMLQTRYRTIFSIAILPFYWKRFDLRSYWIMWINKVYLPSRPLESNYFEWINSLTLSKKIISTIAWKLYHLEYINIFVIYITYCTLLILFIVLDTLLIEEVFKCISCTYFCISSVFLFTR